MNKSSVGKLGEDYACKYLFGKGYQIIGRNWGHKLGEIDIITKASDGTLVFIEVKTLIEANKEDSAASLRPEDNLSRSKLIKLKKVCDLYANANQKLVSEKNGWRIDLVSVSFGADGKPDFRHYENIT